MLHDYTTKAHP